MKILAVGDIVGESGVKKLKDKLGSIKNKEKIEVLSIVVLLF